VELLELVDGQAKGEEWADEYAPGALRALAQEGLLDVGCFVQVLEGDQADLAGVRGGSQGGERLSWQLDRNTATSVLRCVRPLCTL
jgi:hypothetical protein